MSKLLKHDERIEWKGKNFEASIVKVEELTPLELIDIEKYLKNTIQNKKDMIIQTNQEIDTLKEKIKVLEKEIKELDDRLRNIFAKNITIARRNMSKADKKKLIDKEEKEAEYKLKTEKLVKTYQEVKDFQTGELAS